MSGSSWEALLSGPESIPNVREWLGGPSGSPRVVGKPTRITRCGRETLPDIRELSGGPPIIPGVVGSPS